MHAGNKITWLFTLTLCLCLSLVCGFIYYFSYISRIAHIKTYLTNRAITTANMLDKPETFGQALMTKIDSITQKSVKNETIQVYNFLNERIFTYSDAATDTLPLTTNMLQKVRANHIQFITIGSREAIAYYANNNNRGNVILAAAFDEEGNKTLSQLKIILLLTFICGSAMVIALAYFFTKKLLQPIRKIANAITDINALSLESRIQSENMYGDWKYLTTTLNELLNRLQKSFEIQRRFISSASHELSTPLTSISSQLEVSLQRNRKEEEYREVMQSILQDVRHLSKLTQTLLTFATASGVAGGLQIKPVRIDEILMQLPGEISKTNNEFSVKLEFDELPENADNLLVFGNEDLLFTAIKNVVSNACKYSTDGVASIKLSVELKEIIIAVKGNGKGIPDNELEHIFQPFYRAEDSRTIGGFGVGLPLVDRIVKLHKGEIKIHSIVGKETTFNIHLPIAENIG